MSFISQHKLKITTLSPVHIGCGDTYEPTNYIIDQGALFAFNSVLAMEVLSEEIRSKLLDIVSGKPNDNMLKEVQSFFYENRNTIIPNASHIIPVNSNISDFYKERLGKTIHSEGRGKNVINKLGIERTTFNPIDHLLYLPGSSIKGAIRTALLNQINNNSKLKNKYEKNRELQQRLFKYDMRTLQKDPMRLVSISDAHVTKMKSIPQSDIQFAVNRKRYLKDRDGNSVKSMAESKGLYQILEATTPLNYQLFDTQLNFQKFSSTQLQIHRKSLPEKPFHWKIGDIVEACNRFYFPLFCEEMELLMNLNYLNLDWSDRVHNIVSNILEDMNSNHIFLLRLGRHSGAEAETLNKVRNIKIMQGKNANPRYENKPTTFWLASKKIDSKTDMMPFGWVLVEVDPNTEGDLKKHFENPNKNLQTWLTEKREYQQELYDKTKQQKEKEKKSNQKQEKEKQQREKEISQWDKMNDEEKNLATIHGDKVAMHNLSNSDPIQIVWPKIDSFTTEHQHAVALAFKKRWQANGKWEGKISKKQTQKVQKVKAILKLNTI